MNSYHWQFGLLSSPLRFLDSKYYHTVVQQVAGLLDAQKYCGRLIGGAPRLLVTHSRYIIQKLETKSVTGILEREQSNIQTIRARQDKAVTAMQNVFLALLVAIFNYVSRLIYAAYHDVDADEA